MTLDSAGVAGPSPVQALGCAFAGCMATDVAYILTRGRHAFHALRAHLVADRAPDEPHRVIRMTISVTVEGDAIELTPTEFKLLLCLLRQPGRAFNRHQLMDAAIGEGSIVLERTIDVHVKTLRHKIKKAGGAEDLIETVRGVGYRLQETKNEG